MRVTQKQAREEFLKKLRSHNGEFGLVGDRNFIRETDVSFRCPLEAVAGVLHYNLELAAERLGMNPKLVREIVDAADGFCNTKAKKRSSAQDVAGAWIEGGIRR